MQIAGGDLIVTRWLFSGEVAPRLGWRLEPRHRREQQFTGRAAKLQTALQTTF